MIAGHALALWLEQTHPELFQALYRGLMRRRMGALGDDLDLSEVGSLDVGSVDTSTTDFGLTDFSTPALDMASIDTSAVSLPIDTGSSTSFLTSLTDAAASVGNALTDPKVLSGLVKVGTAYFQTQANATNAAVQSQVLQAQAARAAAGQTPAPVTYVQTANGQLVPVYQTSSPNQIPAGLTTAVSSGQAPYVATAGVTGYAIPPSHLTSVLSGLSLSSLLPWIAVIFALAILE